MPPLAALPRPGQRSGLLTPAGATAIDVTQIVLWVLVAEWLLPGGGHFHFDEAYFYGRALDAAHGLHLAAYGPPASTTGLPSPGGASVDLLAIPFLLFHGPLAGARWVVLLSGFGALALDRALARFHTDPFLRLAAVTLFTWSHWHARFADRMWNPHLLLFGVPMLLWASAALLGSARPGTVALLWGLAAGCVMQLHGSSVVAVALCVFLLLPAGDGTALSPRFLWAAPLGGLLSYAPYLAAQAHDHFANARRWLAPGLAPRLDATALRLGLESYAIFPSHAAAAFPAHLGGGAFATVQGATFWTAALLLPFGFLVRGRWRLASAAGLALVPLSIWLSGRGYAHHYVVAADPFFVLPVAGGLAFWAARGRHLARLASAYLVAFAVAGVLLMLRDYRWRPQDGTIPEQIQITSDLLAVGPRIHAAPGPLEDDAPVYASLARRLWDRPLQLGRDGTPCALGANPLPWPDALRFPVGRRILTCWKAVVLPAAVKPAAAASGSPSVASP